MWIRLRLDIGWSDLFRGLFTSLDSTHHVRAQHALESFWSRGEDDSLACLSVRSGFDLFLSALDLPHGSEVLFSAITISAMPEIAVEHGLVPVPVDVAGSDLHLDLDSLRRAVTPRSRVLVVAHLFGARPAMAEIVEFAREQGLILVEDCAQAFCSPDWRGDERADASLFSFGSIKSATALGGALCRIRDPSLLARMRSIQAGFPIQSTAGYHFRYWKYLLLHAFSGEAIFGAAVAVASQFGFTIDDMLGELTRGFSTHDLIPQLRQQPSAGLFRMLHYRLKHYCRGPIERRIGNARRIIAQLGLEVAQPELLDARHSFWIMPFLTDQPAPLMAHLRDHGFDTAQRGRLEVVPPPVDRPELRTPWAHEFLRQAVFLPCYGELPDWAIDEMCGLIHEVERPMVYHPII